jgi:hypothetical protein
LHLASNGDTLDPSDGPFLVTFESTLFAFHAGNTGSVALYSPMPAGVTCFKLGHCGGDASAAGLARVFILNHMIIKILMKLDSEVDF